MLAVVDMGSNSFRLEIGRVEGDQIFRLDTVRETLRIGAGMDRRGRLTVSAQRRALEGLARLGERLRGFPREAVRAVATQTFRAATNIDAFMPRAEAALGFPIDIIGGNEEARLIYLGVAHELPPSPQPRLVVDIGGGSTEFILGQAMTPLDLDSLTLGCVEVTQRFFPGGLLTAQAFDAAETHARAQIEAIAGRFERSRWNEAFASSGTALALAEILTANQYSPLGITPAGLGRLRKRMIAAGAIDRLAIQGLKASRAPVLAGGFAIMRAIVAELGAERILPVGGALRLGVLYDLLGRTVRRDSRMLTVEHFIDRYRVDRDHALRVAATAKALYLEGVARPDAAAAQRVEWAALLHEVGFAVSHLGFHKHSAYILHNADMPGFSAGEQKNLALLVLGCRGRLDKVADALDEADMRARILALRIAVLLHHARRPIALPRIKIEVGRSTRVLIAPAWLARHPLTAHLLDRERAEWSAAGHPMTRSKGA